MTFQPTPCVPRDLPGRTVLAFPPDVDLSNTSELYAHIVSVARVRRPRLLVLDLTRTRFMDSQGARLIDDVSRLLHPHTRVRVAAPPDGLPSRVLMLTGVRRDVPVYDHPDEALAA
ncbi:STAS domain-containing protein [Streptomyces sp. TG1A-8]|uniref:STAS domain-containing protein n=1 Tax=Streptomyces sp. TG1A-8 TaxID=3051385 RepID=UPI00265BF2F7|nr:STAS domain-containing protein [Streptomyces sp. TG1A-8]MDO0926966.1 STAS domain-containing protein [Streptomyces sp. TG1A-8]